MKRFIITLSLAIFSCLGLIAAGPDNPKQISVMSYNIRDINSKDGTNSWDYRYPASALMIVDIKPDFIGMQECDASQINYLIDVCEDYKSLGVGIEDGKKKGEHMEIFYKHKLFNAQKWGTFTDHIATWALFKSKKGGDRFYVINAHIAESVEDKKAVLDNIVKSIQELNTDNLPIVFTGCLNIEAGNKDLNLLNEYLLDTRSMAAQSDTEASYHGWGRSKKTIDYIMAKNFSSYTEFRTITSPYYERNFISDHYPILSIMHL